jgi:hypothetical protein
MTRKFEKIQAAEQSHRQRYGSDPTAADLNRCRDNANHRQRKTPNRNRA